MARLGKWYTWYCVLFVLFRVIRTDFIGRNNQGREPAREFRSHAVIRPRYFHGRSKREIASSRDQNGDGHIHDLTIGYVMDGKDYVLDLRLNRELIPESYFERYQHNGRHVVNRPTGKDVELCQYQGHLRGVPGSWAAISTCRGLSGVIFDGEELHYLERGSDLSSLQKEAQEEAGKGPHYLYKHSDLITNHTCGYSGTPHHILENKEINRILRYKRDTEIIQGPYNANKQSRYVELVLVVDNKEYKKMEDNLSAVYHHCKEIANIINSLYMPLNIFISLVGVVVWTETDEITLSSNGDQTLQNFLQYRRQKLVKEQPNDNAQLLTRVQFDGGVVGKALKGPICTYEFSGGVSTDHSEVVGLVATTVAHEMGHNFGMEHDTSECKCPSERCIMASSSNSMRPTQWSSCSLEYLALAFEHGMDYCLRNKPKSLFDSPMCGNGFVEAGEQCDCGLKESCDNPCCNATTCMLYSNASCATGECCDLQTCRPKTAGTECRSADHECDLPEYCTGHSEYCPADVYKMDGETCDRGKAFCYQGSCRTHSDQCRLLWGPSGKSSDMQCYQMNLQGNRHGNCGFNRLNQSYIKCTDDDVYCGMLQCKHLNERLEFGMESVSILSHSFINSGGSIIPCRTVIVDLGLNEVDPGLAPDGAKCGEGKMCVHQRCMSVGALRAGPNMCRHDCNGNGVCNSLGHCHCKLGFAPPLCDVPGTGGSQDSGPASDPNARQDVMTALYIIFLGIVPFVSLVALFMYYTRRNIKYWWKKGSHSPAHISGQGPPPTKLGEKNAQHRISRGSSMAFRPERNFLGSQGLEISSPITADAFSSDNAHASLLPKADGASNNSTNGSPASLQNSLFGQFKGFSITPLPSVVTSLPTQPKPPSPPARNVISNHVAPPVVPSLPAVSKLSSLPPKTAATKVTSAAAAAVSTATAVSSAPALVAAAPRPVISSPVLDATTCTAKELIDAGATPAVPTRPAPQVPLPASAVPPPPSATTASSLANGPVPPSAPAAPTPAAAAAAAAAAKPARPISSPNALNVNVPTSLADSVSEEKKKKDAGASNHPTLTRLASFMMRSQNSSSTTKNQPQTQGLVSEKAGKNKNKIIEGSNSLPRKVNKLQIDRDTLRTLEISNPIPQQEIEIPQKAVPVCAAPSVPEDEEASKNVVMRAQSMRGSGPVTQRPAIHTFGSMRQPHGTKRPTSIPTCARPTSPPPRPPPPPGTKLSEMDTGIIGLPGYQNPPLVNQQQDYAYDDCLNLIPSGSAPLANIDEETSPSVKENIYAVIEESPPEKEKRRLGSGAEYTLPLSPKSAPESLPGIKNKFEYTSPTFNEYKTPKPVDNSISAGSVESVGLLSEIVNEIQARNMESIYSTSKLGKKKKQDGTPVSDDEANDVPASVIPSNVPPFPDKNSVVASSNSSLGTYVNAPYTSSGIYKPMGSVYSNLSSQGSVTSTICKPSTSSSSSSSGYLSPMNVINTPVVNTALASQDKTIIRATPVVSSTASTLSSAPIVQNGPVSKIGDKNNSSAVGNIQSYRPYSSSLQRSFGPLASTFQSTTGSHKDKVESQPKDLSRNKFDKPSSATSFPSAFTAKPTSAGSLDTKIQSKPSILPNKSSLHSSIPPSVVPRPGLSSSDVPKTSLSAPTNTSSLHKDTTNPASVGKAPDVVSSCAVGGSGSAGKSPDVVGGGKLESRASSKPAADSSANGAVTKLGTAVRVGSGTGSGVNRTQSSASSVNKGGNAPAAKAAVGHSSLRSSVGKSPQPVTKTLAPRAGADSTSVSSVKPTMSEKKVAGVTASVRDVRMGAARGGGLTKSASDAAATRTMPVGARAAASKLSHVASLQQKFETAASGSDKPSVHVPLRAPSNTETKSKPSLISAGNKTGVNSTLKK